MSDRQVKIIIAADVASAIRGLTQVQQGLGQVAQQGQQAGSQAESFGDKLKAGLEVAGVTLGLAGVAAGIKHVISTGMEFQDNMLQLQSVTQSTDKTMAGVSERAQALGSDLTIPATSAGDAAGAMLELAKGGMTVSEAMEAARGTLLLSAAAQISGAEAATLQSNALNAFGLAASSATHVADLMANTANAASGSVEDVGEALTKVGGIANSFGINIEDTATALGVFAKNGVTGAESGTLLRGVITGLNNQSGPAQKAMAALGLEVFDAQGKFVGMASVTEQLTSAQARMTDEQFNANTQIVFGNEAMAGATYLAAAAGAGWADMSNKVQHGAGVQEAAAAQTKGLSGSFDQFMSAIDGVSVSLFQQYAPAMQDAVSLATSAVGVIGDLASWFSQLPGPVQAAAVALGAVAILAGPLNALWAGMGAKLAAAGAAWGAFSARVAAASGVMATAGVVGRTLMGALGGPLGIALAVGATALAVFAGSSSDASAETEGLTEAIDGQTGALTTNAAQLLADKAATSGAGQAYKNLGGDVGDYVDAMGGVPGAQEKVNAVIEAGRAAYEAQQKAVGEAAAGQGNFGSVAETTAGQMGDLAPSIFDVNKAAEFLASTDATLAGRQAEVALTGEGMKGALGGAGAAAAGAAPSVEALADSLKAATENAQLMASLTEGATQLGAVSAAASDAARALDLFKIAQDKADGRSRSLDDALVAQQSTLMALTAAWDDGTAAATENKEAGDLNQQALLDWNVTALAATEDGRKLYGELSNLADQHMETTEAAYSNEIAENRVAGANEVARKTATDSRAAFLTLAQQHGLNEEQAVTLANKLGILDGTQINDKVFDTINQDAEAQRKLREAQAAEIANKTFQVNATDNATPFLQRVQSYTINDKTFRITQINETQYRTATGQIAMADGGIVHAASGLLVGGRGTSTVRDGSGPGLTWAEAATNKEYYLSMKAGMESRNRALASMAVKDLGGQATWGRAGDVRAGSFSPSMGTLSGRGSSGPVQLTIRLQGDGPITEAALGAAAVTVNGAFQDYALRIERSKGQS